MPIWLHRVDRSAKDLFTIGWGRTSGLQYTVETSDSLSITDDLAIGIGLTSFEDLLNLQEGDISLFSQWLIDTGDTLTWDELVELEGVDAFIRITSSDQLALLDFIATNLISNIDGGSYEDTLALLDAISTNFAIQLTASGADTLESFTDAVSTSLIVNTLLTVLQDDQLSLDDLIELLQRSFATFTDGYVLQDNLVLSSFPPSSPADSFSITDDISVLLSAVGGLNNLTVDVSDEISITDFVRLSSSYDIEDYFRRHLNDRKISGTAHLEWFKDTISISDDINVEVN